MTAERRLAKLEGALSPLASTLLWLAEAQQFGSLPAYVAWLVDQPISAAPLERVPAQARAGALEAMRGQPREAVRDAAHRAVRDAVFLVELVLRLNSMADETIRIESLRYAALFWEMRAIGAEGELARRGRSRSDRSGSSFADRWQAWCSATVAFLTGIHAAEEARVLLEGRYLDGHPALFPEAIEDWVRLQESAERLASLVGPLPLLPAVRRRAPRSAEIEPGDLNLDAVRFAARTQAPTAAARLVDEARAATLAAVGDADGATAMVARRLRARSEASM
jgi:hypothetical protein